MKPASSSETNLTLPFDADQALRARVRELESERDRLREELTLAKIDHHAEAVDELDVEGILAFAERVLPRASDLWVQASLNQKQRLQQLFFGDGVAFDGKQFVRTAVTASAFKYLTAAQRPQNDVASPTGFEPVFWP